MGWLDKVVGFFSPRAEARRERARMNTARYRAYTRKYEAASKSARLENWTAGTGSADAENQLAMVVLRQRTRQQIRDNAWAKAGKRNYKKYVVGVGLKPQARGKNREAERLNELWVPWGETLACDADSRNNFYGLQSLVVGTMAESGAALIRRRWRRWGEDAPGKIAMQIQVMEPDFIDLRKDTILKNGAYIKQGIEFNKRGQRVAYWLYPEHPGELGMHAWRKGFLSKRVKASEIIHVFDQERPGQNHGVSWFHAILTRLKDLDEFDDAELLRRKIAACFAAFIRDLEVDQDETDIPDLVEKINPGGIELLPPGKTIEFADPPETREHKEFTGTHLRAISSGLGQTYEALTGDLSEVNFSSARMGRSDMNLTIDDIRWRILVPVMCDGVWRWFNEAAILAGEVQNFHRATWTPPRREYVEPTKDVKALKDAVRSGFMSHMEAIRSRGGDPEQVLEEIAAFLDKLDKLGIVLDTDPRKTGGTGRSKKMVMGQ